MSDLDRLLAKENEIARLMGALLRIANIKNELDGDDWSEIEKARQIARAALTTQCACRERDECDHSCMPDVIDGYCSHCGGRHPAHVTLEGALFERFLQGKDQEFFTTHDEDARRALFDEYVNEMTQIELLRAISEAL